MVILNTTKRKKIDLRRVPASTIPAGKAGGRMLYGASPAVFEWFMLDGSEDGMYAIDEEARVSTLPEKPEERRELTGDEAAALRAEADQCEDVTERILDHLLEAERLAEPADFTGIKFDMGCPVGYVEILRQKWLQARGAS